jgi:polar amino acid transport system substrate-binding protein
MKAAVAPTGTLRVAFPLAVIFGMKDPATGELKGPAVDLGKELARRVGVPFEPVAYANPSALIRSGKFGEWDVVMIGINDERAAVIDFSAPYMELEQGYLARPGVSFAKVSDVDQAGVRIGVTEKSGGDIYLSGTLKNATLVRVKSFVDLYALLGSVKAAGVDVITTGKPGLFGVAAKYPGSRVLDGRIFVEPIGMGVPKGRHIAAAAYVSRFVDEAKAEGLVSSAIERAGLRGVVVAPSK